MRTSLARLLTEYAELERRVQSAISRVCRPLCAKCSQVCCRTDICIESRESPFLARLRAQAAPEVEYDSERGFLGPSGCRLPVGRPPVCYSFNCPTILNAQGGSVQVYGLQVISELINFAGRRALGSRHLVALLDDDQMARVKPDRILKKVRLAGDLLDTARECLEQGKLDPAAADRLKVVIRMRG
jgi:hypothetical protein